MKIVISGYYGSGNAGDEAMLDSILQLLAEKAPKASVTVISVNPLDTQRSHKVKAVSHLNPFAVVKTLFSADLLISGGGSLLQNVTSSRSLYYYLGVITLALILRCKVMLFAQGIGPIFGDFARSVTRLILNRVNLITVRDRGSLVELSRLKVTTPKIECTADPVLALRPVSLDFGRSVLRKEGASIGTKGLKSNGEVANVDSQQDPMLLGVEVRRWRNFNDFKIRLADALDALNKAHNKNKSHPLKVVFIPMQISSDVEAADEVAALTKIDCIVLREHFSTQQLLSIVGCMDVLIGIRLHALIFAGVMSVPMVGVSYDPKIERFLNSIGQEPVGTLEEFEPDRLVAAVLALKRSAEGAIGHFGDTFGNYDSGRTSGVDLSQLRVLAEENVNLALSLIR